MPLDVRDVVDGNECARHRARAIDRPSPEALARDVEGLETFALENVGSHSWRAQRATIARLRALAYDDAVMCDESDETRPKVASALTRAQKFETLLRELLCAETWRAEALPRALALEPKLMDDVVMNFAIYLTIYHESVLCNLLELSVFERGTYADVSDDVVVELADYCHRALVRLNALAMRRDDEDGALDDDDSIHSKVRDVELALSLSTLGIFRSITDTLSERTLGIQARLLDSYDALGVLVPLLDFKPWLRRHREDDGVLQQYTDGAWCDVHKSDEWDTALRVGKYEAQVWLSVHALLCEPSCRRKYRWDETRKATALRLKRHLNESKMDQIPVLRDVARALDELDVATPPPRDMSQGRFILEVIPTIRTALTHGVDYDQLARTMLQTHFNVRNIELKHQLAADAVAACETFTPPERRVLTPSTPLASTMRAPTSVKIDILRERRSLISSEVSYDTVCAVEYDLEGDPTEVRTKTSNARGLRRKLARRSVDADDPEFSSFDGKVRVTYDSRSITAIVRLRPTRATDASSVWISVGALRSDGFAAQLKLARVRASASAYRLADAYITVAAR